MRKSNKRFVSELELTEIVKKSKTISNVLKMLDFRVGSVNYKFVHKLIKEYNIDISHFDPYHYKASLKTGRPLDVYLNNEFEISSHSLRKKLLKNNIFEEKCYKCNRTEWENQKIPLQLHHIDGNHKNNKLDNLTILCANCHAQTDNFTSKSLKKKYYCNICNREKSKYSPNCVYCANFNLRKVDWPNKEELLCLLKTKSIQKIGKKYGVDGNSVRKWCDFYNLPSKKAEIKKLKEA